MNIIIRLLILLVCFGCSSEWIVQTQGFKEGLEHYDKRKFVCDEYYIVHELFEDGDIARLAAGEWNHALGIRLFEFESDHAEDGKIIKIIEKMPDDVTIGAEAFFRLDSCNCRIEVNPVHSTNVRVFIHEIGHCLGLKHSDNPKSIMYTSPASESVFTSEMIELIKNNIID